MSTASPGPHASALLSIVSRKDLVYPDSTEYFSPSEAYPEYRLGHIAKMPNRVYAAVREVFRQAGLDAANFGTASWNPLASYIAPGSRVFLLCNFVYHKRLNESNAAFSSKCTHASVLRAVLDYVLLAAGRQGKVAFGNAPIQSCDWNRVLRETGAAAVVEFCRERNLPVEARDLRCNILRCDLLGRVISSEERDTDQVQEIDFGSDSLLACSEWKDPKFRGPDYDHHRSEQYQGKLRHVYAIHRAMLESDVIFSVPKLKVHGKVGITCGIKGLVGAVAFKESLAHHRRGGPLESGDEYPKDSLVQRLATNFHDWVYERPVTAATNVARIIDRNLRRMILLTGRMGGGAWYGNDTCWRMAIDLARILTYARRDGTMAERPQRRHLMLVDGVVGGEGDGPLAPAPVPCGTILFSDNLALGDAACCRIFGFDIDKVPIVREAFQPSRYPLTDARQSRPVVVLNGVDSTFEEVLPPVRPFRAPRGWRGHVEQSAEGRP